MEQQPDLIGVVTVEGLGPATLYYRENVLTAKFVFDIYSTTFSHSILTATNSALKIAIDKSNPQVMVLKTVRAISNCGTVTGVELVFDVPIADPREVIVILEKKNLETRSEIDQIKSHLRTRRRYESGWIAVQSNTCNELDVQHGLNDFPTRCMILFSPTNPPEKEIYDMSMGGWYDNTHLYNSAIHSASVKYTETTVTIGIWSGGYVGRFWSNGTSWKFWKTGFYKIVVEK